MDQDEMVEFFGEPISTYTASQAVEDGILVPVGKRDLVTRPCWEFMAEKLGDSPPNQWTVNLLGYVMAKDGNDRALAASGPLIDTYKKQATRVWEENIGGGVFTLWVEVKQNRIVGVYQESERTEDQRQPMRKVWMIPNELGGITLMFPEDR